MTETNKHVVHYMKKDNKVCGAIVFVPHKNGKWAAGWEYSDGEMPAEQAFLGAMAMALEKAELDGYADMPPAPVLDEFIGNMEQIIQQIKETWPDADFPKRRN